MLKKYKVKSKKFIKKQKPKRQNSYIIVRKISPLTYKLDFSQSQFRIYPVINIQHFARYECDNDPFYRIPPPLGPVEYEKNLEHPGNPKYEVYKVEKILNYA